MEKLEPSHAAGEDVKAALETSLAAPKKPKQSAYDPEIPLQVYTQGNWKKHKPTQKHIRECLQHHYA